MKELRIELFGKFKLIYNRKVNSCIESNREKELLAYLLLNRETPQSRKFLSFLFWADSTEAQAMNNLRKVLYTLKKNLPNPDRFLLSDHKFIQWNKSSPWWLDVAAFEEEILTAGKAEERNDSEQQISALKKASDLYKNHLFITCYEEWIESEREKLKTAYNICLNTLVNLLEKKRDYRSAIVYAKKLIELDSYNEVAYRRLMKLYSLNQERSKAIQIYNTCSEVLEKELGVKPSTDTQLLYERLKAVQKPVSAIDYVNAPGNIIHEEERKLIGRADEWEIILNQWRKTLQGELTMILIKGEAGIGKTRLAREYSSYLARQGYQVISARAYASAQTISYGLVADCLRDASVYNRLNELDHTWLNELVRLLPELKITNHKISNPKPIMRFWEKQGFLKAISVAITYDKKPKLLLLDNIHWADPASLEWLDYLFNSVQPGYLMVTGTFRPDEASCNNQLLKLIHNIQKDKRLAKISLSGLAEAETMELASAITGESVSRETAKNLYNETDGNPILIEEFLIGTEEFTGKKTGAQPEYSSYFPQPLTKLVGRKKELVEIGNLFTESRLLTLTGTGGSGKTRLAIQFADENATEFKDGIVFVDLSTIRESKLVGSTIARQLNVKEISGQALPNTLKSYLLAKQILLVLDNFEHVIAAAPLVAELVSSAQKLKIIVTSRQALNIQGEQEYPVHPLSVPSMDAISDIKYLKQNESIILFVQRAKNVKPGFEISDSNAKDIAALCIRLDGLPLAIELAAARIKILSPRGIVDRLGNRFTFLVGGATDRPERQQTLRAAIEWSYDLLTAKEKIILRRLSVFSGGCTLDAAKKVCHAHEPVNCEILDGISSLVNKNLVRAGESMGSGTRFIMLESIRDFSLEKLNGQKDEHDTVLNAHQDYYVQLCEEAKKEITGPGQAVWMQYFEEEHANLRKAVEWGPGTANGLEKRLKIASVLWRYWLSRGYFSEGRKRLAELIRHSGIYPYKPDEPLAQVMLGAGTLAHNNGDYTEAYTLISKCLDVYRSLNDSAGIAMALNNLGWAAFRTGNYSEGWSLTRESFELHRRLKDNRGIAFSLNNLGWIAHHRGEFRSAEKYHDECLHIRRELGNIRNIAFSMAGKAWALQRQGKTESAIELTNDALKTFEKIIEKQLYSFTLCIKADALADSDQLHDAGSILKTEALPVFREIGDTYGCAFALNSLGLVLFRENKLDEGLRYFEESYRLRSEIGDRWGVAQSLCNKGRALLQKGITENVHHDLMKSLDIRREIQDKCGLAETLEAFSEYYYYKQLKEKAVFLASIAIVLREIIHSPRSHEESTIYRKIEDITDDMNDEIMKAEVNAIKGIGDYNTLLKTTDEKCRKILSEQ